MKTNLLAIAALCCLVGSTKSWAENEPARPAHLISLDVGHFVYSLVPPSSTVLVPLEYEGAIGDMVSLVVAPSLALRSGTIGIGLGVAARFYLINGPAVSGLWLGPELGVLYGVATPTSFTGAWAFSLGAGLGYNLLLGEHLMLSPGVKVGAVGLGSSTILLDFSPRLAVGYAF